MILRQIESLTERLGSFVSEHYGLEIQKLSTVYVNVDDISPEEMFSLPEEKVSELEDLAESLLKALREERQVEDIKRAAVLYDHLMLLMKYNKVDASRFDKAAKELEQMLDAILNKPTSGVDDMSISDLERIQLRNMLDSGSFSNSFSLARILRLLWVKGTRWWLGRKQFKTFRAITGKKIQRRT